MNTLLPSRAQSYTFFFHNLSHYALITPLSYIIFSPIVLLLGAVAKKILKLYSNVDIVGYVQKVQDIELLNVDHDTVTEEQVEANIARCPDPVVAEAMIARIDEIRKTGNSIGGVVEVVARNVPAGLGSMCLFL